MSAEEREIPAISALLDWTADALEALQVGDIERAQHDLNAIHYRLLAEIER